MNRSTLKCAQVISLRPVSYTHLDVYKRQEFALSEVWAKGGEGGVALAEKVLKTLETKESHYCPIYPLDMKLEDKIDTIAREIYGADKVTYSPAAKKTCLLYTSHLFSRRLNCYIQFEERK